MLLEGKAIAIIEDDAVMGESLVQSLGLEGAKVTLFPSGEAAKMNARFSELDLIVCDMRLPGMDGRRLFEDLRSAAETPPFLFMTAYGEIDQAVALMRDGAADYVTKPFDMDLFLQRVQSSLRPEIAANEYGVLGVSAAMRGIETLLRRVANIDSPVLLTGETGTGKDVCARFLHSISDRRGPFMAVNCAAIPGELLESELFGHEAGAFTGAMKRHMGYAERASEGILFLDEIGDLPLPMQAKLLRLLEDRTFFRIGGEVPIPFKARLVAATNADLAGLMTQKKFRTDLYYRINVMELSLPALRERKDDIPWLMTRFFDLLSRDADGAPKGITADAETAALEHFWPGNVRELRNRMERALALAPGERITARDLFPDKQASAIPELAPRSLADAREAAERRQIALTLSENDGQIGKTATVLGVSRTTLWEKMKRYGLADC